jgi:hypothetical protein
MAIEVPGHTTPTCKGFRALRTRRIHELRQQNLPVAALHIRSHGKQMLLKKESALCWLLTQH